MSSERVHQVYVASYRRLVVQLTGVTGDPVEAGTTSPTYRCTRSPRPSGCRWEPSRRGCPAGGPGSQDCSTPPRRRTSCLTASVLPSAVAELAADPRSHPFALAGNADGSVAVIWRDLVQPGPTFALVVRDAAAPSGGG